VYVKGFIHSYIEKDIEEWPWVGKDPDDDWKRKGKQ
jgi:hypothetical protein